jgi:hypothetical protein
MQPAHNSKFETTLTATINWDGPVKKTPVLFTQSGQNNLQR